MSLKIVVWLGYFIDSILATYYFSNMLEYKIKKKKGILLLWASLFLIATALAFFAHDKMNIRFPVMLFTIILACVILFKDKLIYKVFVVISNFAIVVISEAVSAVFCTNVLKQNLFEVANKLCIEKIVAMLLYYATNFLLILVVFKYIKKKTIDYKSKAIAYVLVYFTVQIIIFYFLIFNIFTFRDSPYNYFVLFITSLLSFGFGGFLLFVFNQQNKNEIRLEFVDKFVVEQQRHIYFAKQQAQEMRRIKHDFNNNIITINELIQKKKYEKAQNYVQELTDNIKGIQYTFCENTIADTIITNKFIDAINQGIKTDFKATLPENIIVSDLDISSLINNLFDNAIRGTFGCNEKYIELLVLIKDANLLINLKNSVLENVDVNNLKTTKMDKDNHGNGIEIIRNIVKKYKGNIVFECKNNEFIVMINIPLD
jgi:hypothetical protein